MLKQLASESAIEYKDQIESAQKDILQLPTPKMIGMNDKDFLRDMVKVSGKEYDASQLVQRFNFEDDTEEEEEEKSSKTYCLSCFANFIVNMSQFIE